MSVFSNMKRLAMRKGYALLRSKGANCPECGSSLDLPRELPEGDDLLHCSACSWSGGMMDLMASNDGWGEVREQPAGSKIVKSSMDGGTQWLMPASKKPNFLCFFALLWLGFVGFITFTLLFGTVEGEDPVWVFLLFLIPFWAVGLGVGYGGLRMMLMESILVVDQSEVRLMQRLFGKVKLKRLGREEVKCVERYTAYSQNERPVYGLRIATGGKEKIAFGSRLKEDEKRWLLSELREVLDLQSRRKSKVQSTAQAAEYGGAVSLISYEDLEEISEGGLEVKRVGYDGFRMKRKHQSGKWYLLGGVVGLVVSVFLFSEAFESLDLESEDFGLLDLVSLLFDVMPFVIGLVFGAMAIGALFAARHFMGLVEYFEFSPQELVVRKAKQGQRGKVTRYAKDVFHSATRRNTGHVNNDPRYSVSLKGRNKRVMIVGYVPGDRADRLVEWLELWLGD